MARRKTTPQEKFKPADVAEALARSGGFYSGAARILAAAHPSGSCTRETVKRYVDTHDVCRAAYEDALDLELDVSESVVLQVRDGKKRNASNELIDDAESKPRDRLNAAEKHLRAKGKRRGWGDAVDVTVTGRNMRWTDPPPPVKKKPK